MREKLEGFADFPIDIGAEWIHTHPRVLVSCQRRTAPLKKSKPFPIAHRPFKHVDGEELRSQDWTRFFYCEYKSLNTTWYDFFDQHIVPSIADSIRYETVVTEIDYTGG